MTGTENYFAATDMAYAPGNANIPPSLRIASTPIKILFTLYIIANAFENGVIVAFLN